MPAALRAWFAALAPRERLMILGAAAFATFAVIYAGAIRPVLVARSEATARISEQQALLADIESLVRRVGPVRSSATAADNTGGQSLVVLVDRTTRERGLGAYLKRNQPDSGSGVRLRMENVPFDLLLEWLIDAQTRYGLTAIAASFDPSGENGRVNSNLVLAKARP
jgi:general secretion pathway protein M